MSSFTIVGIVGSLRKGSFNKSLLTATAALAPAGTEFVILDIAALPLFNQDDEMTMPAAVKALKEAVKSADAVVFATPEYNYSVPGVLKNAIDWLSRPYGQNSLDGKPAAIIGTSSGLMGSSRAQYHLRQILGPGLNVQLLNRPEIIVTGAADKFDAKGELTDPKTKEKLSEMLTALVAWAKKLK